jgi:hypothetical protein
MMAEGDLQKHWRCSVLVQWGISSVDELDCDRREAVDGEIGGFGTWKIEEDQREREKEQEKDEGDEYKLIEKEKIKDRI